MGKGARLRKVRQTAMGSFDRDQRRALQKLIDEEVTKTINDWDKRFWEDIVASVLWALHEACGFGPVRLERFYHRFDELHQELKEYYSNDYTASDEINNGWICRKKLLEIGIDVDAWDAKARQMAAERERNRT